MTRIRLLGILTLLFAAGAYSFSRSPRLTALNGSVRIRLERRY